MNKFLIYSAIIISLLFLFSCDWPKTIVTNFIHPDGSVTRKVVMKHNKETINPENYRVPVDSSWTFFRSLEVKNNDTVWIITAEKDFASVEEINRDYKTDRGINKNLNRRAEFTKEFKWFTTKCTFTEKVEKVLNVELKAEDYFSKSEFDWFHMSEEQIDSLLKGGDSLKYKTFNTVVDSIAGRYLLEGLIDEWSRYYLEIVPDSEFILNRTGLIVDSAIKNSDIDPDSVFKQVLGEEYYLNNKVSIETTLSVIDSIFSNILSLKFYTLETIMPGKLILSNGYKHEDGRISWPVNSKYFVSQDYIMRAESKLVNWWAWLVSALIVMLPLYLSFKMLFKIKL